MFENNLSEIFTIRSLLDLLTALIIDRSIFLFLAVEAKALTSFGKGYNVQCYDPEAMNNAKKENSNLIYFNSAYEACEGASAIIIGTEWNEFRALNFKKISKILKEKIIFDLRNIYIPEDLKDLGFNYYGTGK